MACSAVSISYVVTSTSNVPCTNTSSFRRLRSASGPWKATARRDGHQRRASATHVGSTDSGHTTRCGPHSPLASRRYCKKLNTWRVFPRPMSSPRMPPPAPATCWAANHATPSRWYGRSPGLRCCPSAASAMAFSAAASCVLLTSASPWASVSAASSAARSSGILARVMTRCAKRPERSSRSALRTGSDGCGRNGTKRCHRRITNAALRISTSAASSLIAALAASRLSFSTAPALAPTPPPSPAPSAAPSALAAAPTGAARPAALSRRCANALAECSAQKNTAGPSWSVPTYRRSVPAARAHRG
mmetsp:Transcript_15216/g.37394  ORF Transcript_15216/g.37394 Transcript_15216/m.37394 type:complete len:304 (+) Transcript_15216:946-1857(+)